MWSCAPFIALQYLSMLPTSLLILGKKYPFNEMFSRSPILLMHETLPCLKTYVAFLSEFYKA